MFTIFYKTSEGTFLQYNDGIYAVKDKQEAIKNVEETYNNNHKRGYEASMSACLNFIQYQPRVVEIPDDPNELMNGWLVTEPDGGVKPMQLKSVSGFMIGLKVTEEKAEWIEQNHDCPRLISKEDE